MDKKYSVSILALNCGSSSIKFALLDENDFSTRVSGSITHLGTPKARFSISRPDSPQEEVVPGDLTNLKAALDILAAWLVKHAKNYPFSAIGHRLVQGGPGQREPVLLDQKFITSLREFVYLAPNHLPDEIQSLELMQENFPDLPQVACFDNAFHQNMPERAKYYPLDFRFREKGLMRYGYHGLSYEYLMHVLSEDSDLANKKIILAHLGNGASMAAVAGSTGMDTTMGLSPIGGLVMSSRSGDLDPGVVIFLMKTIGLSADEVEQLLSKEAGLQAISGMSDVQEIEKAAAGGNTRAGLALEVFCYQARKTIGSFAAALGGLDLLVFTGGIGEHAAAIRSGICQGLDFMGIELDAGKNTKAGNDTGRLISAKSARVEVQVIKTNEEWVIARHTKKLISKNT